ncbi:DEAD/DEAH box helicase [Streptomyces sp. NRRL S-1813]|uniref:DEAD/DEAH box helicase n=1 Tax=Streptomyces sp. NRRL S-1813 TaxID=1463888 RepID=UPI0004CC6C87|nr:DEAD/DEAH box helicase [Streptomyces sp. NRRL S-1813]
MNRTARTNDRYSRSAGSSGSGRGGYRSGGPNRSGTGRSGGPGRRPATLQGEFALPVTHTPALPPAETFAELDMPPALLAALGAEGMSAPFPIQAATLPNSLAGRDVLGRGRTGSGKTLAFGLALLARTAGQRAEPRQPLALVLVPTRELAQQVTDALTPYARSLKLRLATVVGGMSIGRQSSALRGGVEVVVATPGRLKDLIERGDCRLNQVAITVLDEADQMADMGFMPQVTALLTMEHHVLHVHGADKHATTIEIAAREGRSIMFLDTKHAVDNLTKHLLSSGVRAAALHGGKSQPQRTRTLAQFKTGHVTVLVATNVAARGIHVDNLDLVVNVDPPSDHKDYLHRGGRTARAGESGSVVTLVLPNQRRTMSRLMADAGITPQSTQVRSGEAELSRITGAQAPSGIPVTIAAPVVERAKRSGSSTRGRRSRPAQARRAAGSSRTATPTARQTSSARAA